MAARSSSRSRSRPARRGSWCRRRAARPPRSRSAPRGRRRRLRTRWCCPTSPSAAATLWRRGAAAPSPCTQRLLRIHPRRHDAGGGHACQAVDQVHQVAGRIERCLGIGTVAMSPSTLCSTCRWLTPRAPLRRSATRSAAIDSRRARALAGKRPGSGSNRRPGRQRAAGRRRWPPRRRGAGPERRPCPEPMRRRQARLQVTGPRHGRRDAGMSA